MCDDVIRGAFLRDVTSDDVHKVRSAQMGARDPLLARAMQARLRMFVSEQARLMRRRRCAPCAQTQPPTPPWSCPMWPCAACAKRSAGPGIERAAGPLKSSCVNLILRVPAKLGRTCVRPANPMTCTADGLLLYRSLMFVHSFISEVCLPGYACFSSLHALCIYLHTGFVI
jgi:hypothetical protein